MTGYRIIYTARLGPEPGNEASTLANVYAFLVDRRTRATGTNGGSSDAERKVRHDESGTKRSLPEGD